MHRLLTLAFLGITGIALVNPQESQAQIPVGVQVQVGPGRVIYQPGYPYAAPGYVVSQPVYPTTVVAAPAPVAVAPSIYVGWRWDGHRWYRPGHYYHR